MLYHDRRITITEKRAIAVLPLSMNNASWVSWFQDLCGVLCAVVVSIAKFAASGFLGPHALNGNISSSRAENPSLKGDAGVRSSCASRKQGVEGKQCLQ